MVCLAQTMNLSCTDTNIVSKWTETRLHMTHVTKEFHRVHTKWFQSMWYVQRKSCIYLALTLTLSPNGIKWDSTRPTSPKSSIGAYKMISEVVVHLAQIMHQSCIKISTISKRNESSFYLSLISMEYHWVGPKWFLRLWYIWCKPCTYLALTLTIPPNGPKWDSTLSHKSLHQVRPKWFYEPMVCSAQSVHLSCVKISTISK
jgi:hypothetical protein